MMAIRIALGVIHAVNDNRAALLATGVTAGTQNNINDRVVDYLTRYPTTLLPYRDVYMALVTGYLATEPKDGAGVLLNARLAGGVAVDVGADGLGVMEVVKAYDPDVFKNAASMSALQATDDTMDSLFKTGSLKYFNGKELVDVPVGKETARVLFTLGKLRFDTMLVRNEIFVTLIQRMLRHKMRRDLTFYNQKVVKDLPVTASSITELYGRDITTDGEYKY